MCTQQLEPFSLASEVMSEVKSEQGLGVFLLGQSKEFFPGFFDQGVLSNSMVIESFKFV